jgi:hypothetical protein
MTWRTAPPDWLPCVTCSRYRHPDDLDENKHCRKRTGCYIKPPSNAARNASNQIVRAERADQKAKAIARAAAKKAL